MDNTPAIVIASSVVGILGIVGIAFAIRQWIDRNRSRIPRLIVKTPNGITPSTDGRLHITVANTRGSADRFLIVIHAGYDFYVYDDALGANTPAQDFGSLPRGRAADEMRRPIKVLAAALDADRRWWDQLGSRSKLNEPFDRWLAERCRAYGRGCSTVIASI